MLNWVRLTHTWYEYSHSFLTRILSAYHGQLRCKGPRDNSANRGRNTSKEGREGLRWNPVGGGGADRVREASPAAIQHFGQQMGF